jgi:hypothetical protein
VSLQDLTLPPVLLVPNLEVSDMVKGIPKKTGEWLQLSCGVEDAFPERMGELVMEKKERVYTYSKPVTSYILVTDALFGFKYLKSLSQ